MSARRIAEEIRRNTQAIRRNTPAKTPQAKTPPLHFGLAVFG